MLKGDSSFVISENDNPNNDFVPDNKNVENFDETPMYKDHNTHTKKMVLGKLPPEEKCPPPPE